MKLNLKAFIVLCITTGTHSITVLLFLIGTTQFERSTFEFLAQQLALRNHRTITVKPILIPEYARLVKPRLHLVYEKTLKNLLPRQMYEPLVQIGDDIPWRHDYEVDAHLLPYYAAHNHSCSKMLNSDLLTNLRNENIDMAIVYSGNPCQLGIVHLLGIPFIYFDLEGFNDETRVASRTGFDLRIRSSQCVINQFSYIDKLSNAKCLLYEYLAQYGGRAVARFISKRYELLDEPITAMFVKKLADSGRNGVDFPSANEMKRNAELYFINTDLLLEYNYALPSNVIPVGGLHIDTPKPLFSPWNDCSNGSESCPVATIIVSFGTQANVAMMRRCQADAIVGALKNFSKYRIYVLVGATLKLGHYGESHMPNNIRLMAFLPQNDLLADKRTRLLVTNGGMHSILEALTYGVPIVGVPLYGPNKHNLAKIVEKQFGIVVDKTNLTAYTLQSAIEETLTNDRYRSNTLTVARLWRSRPAKPLDVALSWVEYVGRNGGAKFLKPSGEMFIDEVIYVTLGLFWFMAALVVPAATSCLLVHQLFRKSR